ncbi:hypothetical protein H5410_018949 [Solanum commersonii]|uniref:Uncharacterized protein n=1 Tax=Solanum commersonii TaxID=4109 RepID=A0A9J6A3I2_SOLCO|nr:hypothetical protein H5410_018949 [Solanum commersonii]
MKKILLVLFLKSRMNGTLKFLTETITGIPCKHAISAIWHENDEVINYVDDYYKVKMYKRIYERAILSINGSLLWPKSGKISHLPPIFSRQNKSGRMQKLRRKEQDEEEANFS